MYEIYKDNLWDEAGNLHDAYINKFEYNFEENVILTQFEYYPFEQSDPRVVELRFEEVSKFVLNMNQTISIETGDIYKIDFPLPKVAKIIGDQGWIIEITANHLSVIKK